MENRDPRLIYLLLIPQRAITPVVRRSMLDLIQLRFLRDLLTTVVMVMVIIDDTDPVVIIAIVTIVTGHLLVVVPMLRCLALDLCHGVILTQDDQDWQKCMELARIE